MGLNRFAVIKDCEKYVRLYIACGNLIVTEDQEQNLQSQTQHLTDNVRITVTFYCGYVTVVDV
jgi:hypothetical protein